MRFPMLVLAILTLNPAGGGAIDQEPASETTFISAEPEAKTEIMTGFSLLYELKFTEAREQFAAWQNSHRDDPLGSVSIAATYLFEEFYRQGVLTSEFFRNDRRLLGGIEGKPDESRRMRFNEANERARDQARRRFKTDSSDADALYALTLATGMQADYASILERRQIESLRLIKEADSYANQLLALRPGETDAWLALGAANYIVGCLPVHTRFILWFGGIHGDRRLGMEQLRKTAADGHYLRPFAKILLALAAVREKQEDLARTQLSDLVDEFPGNPLFAAELAGLHRHVPPAH